MKGPAKAAAIGLATGVLLAAAGLRADERDAVVKVLAQRGRRTAVGTGVIVTADGYVLTAEHVASQGEPGVVYRDRELPAAIVYDPPKNGRDEALLLKIQDDGPFAYVPVASVPPKAGDRVRSYGFPIGAELSINEGVVTKVDEH
ncbi:MAG: trypsin-like peptidase domain-containing protein, partial [Planctomycetes bacterium]|nr:trypsin-like peptidase domain-containing protein [Planctomycetota bacterium]